MLVHGTEVLVRPGRFGSGHSRVLVGLWNVRLNRTIVNHVRWIAVLGVVAVHLMAADWKPSAVTVRVEPEVLVSVHGTQSVGVMIRLSPGSTAKLWIGDNCSTPLAAGFSIGKSGTYEVPIAQLPGSGRMVCLVSAADGLLETVPLLVPRAADAVQCTNSTCYVL